MSRRRAIAAIAVTAAMLGACDTRPVEWREEVRLQGGETIVVMRTASLKANAIAGGGGGSVNECMTVLIVQPVKSDNPGVWNARFVPLVFDRDPVSKEWFMVATLYHCESWYELGRPKLPYTEYRFKNRQWTQQALSPQSLGLVANMLTNLKPRELKNWTADEKDQDTRPGRLDRPAMDSGSRVLGLLRLCLSERGCGAQIARSS